MQEAFLEFYFWKKRHFAKMLLFDGFYVPKIQQKWSKEKELYTHIF